MMSGARRAGRAGRGAVVNTQRCAAGRAARGDPALGAQGAVHGRGSPPALQRRPERPRGRRPREGPGPASHAGPWRKGARSRVNFPAASAGGGGGCGSGLRPLANPPPGASAFGWERLEPQLRAGKERPQGLGGGWAGKTRVLRSAGRGKVDCQPGRGSESAPTRPAPRHLSLILPDREDGYVA